jgi:hypothetical protein
VCIKERQTLSFPLLSFVYMWMKWRYGSLASSRWLLLPLNVERRRANSCKSRPSKCSWPIDDDDQPPSFSRMYRRTTTLRCNMHTHILPEGIEWLVGALGVSWQHYDMYRAAAVSNIPSVCFIRECFMSNGACDYILVERESGNRLKIKRWNQSKILILNRQKNRGENVCIDFFEDFWRKYGTI